MYKVLQQKLWQPPRAIAKLLLIMRLTTLILITAILQVSATGFAQKVTLSERNASLTRILDRISLQTGYDFLYESTKLKDIRNITVNVKEAELKEVLGRILEPQNLVFNIEDNSVVIKEKTPSFLERVVSAFAAIDVRGVVLDEKNEPLVGATVRVKGSSKTTKTNDKGEFYLAGVDENALLEIVFLGYKTREMKVEKDLGMVKMEVQAGELEEVKVTYSTGYETIDKTRATGSFVKVDSTLLSRSVNTNIISRLEGIAPGLLFDRRSTSLGAAQTKLQLRGVYTLSSGTGPSPTNSSKQIGSFASPDQPLIVVDNFPYNGDFNSLNPLDIEDITILRDAAAASIWGAKAGNGVIVITTKKAKFNQGHRVSISSNINIIKKPDLFSLPMISSSETVDLQNYLFQKGYYDNDINNTTAWPALLPVVEILQKQKLSNGAITDAQVNAELDVLRNHDLRDDYMKYVLRDQVVQSYQASFSVGGTSSSTLVSAGFDKIPGESYRNETNRVSLRVNNSFRPMKRMSIQTNIGYTQQNKELNGLSWGTLKIRDWVTPLYLQLADDQGNPLTVYHTYRKSFLDTVGGGKYLDWRYKPLEEVDNKDRTNVQRAILANINLNYDVTSNLKARLFYQYDYNSELTQENSGLGMYATRLLINRFTNFKETNIQKRYPVPVGGILDRDKQAGLTQGLRGQLNFNKNWNGNHEISALGGAEVREATLSIETTRSYGYNNQQGVSAVDLVNTYPVFLSSALIRIESASQPAFFYRDLINRFVSYFGNASYTYKGRYTVSGSARKDASNIFGVSTNKKGRPFWSAGASWRVSDEEFYDLGLIPEFGLRASYGYSGNIDPSATAAAIVTYGAASSNTVSNVPTAVLSGAPNPNLRWEKVGTFNIAADFSTRGGRIRGSVDYYQKKSIDVITAQMMDATTGMISVKANSADMKGKGVDVMLTTQNIVSPNFKWSTNINYSYTTFNVSKLKIEPTLPSAGNGLSMIPREGENPYNILSYKWAGLDPTNGSPRLYSGDQITSDPNVFYNNLQLSDLVVHGPSLPPHFGNILNTFSYKGISLSTNITYQLGYFFRRPYLVYSSLITNNIGHSEYASRWQKPGDEKLTDVPAFVYPVDFNREDMYSGSSATVERGDHIRLNDLNLVYHLEAKILKQKFIKQLGIRMNANNLNVLLWRANKKHLDPQYSSGLQPSKSIALGFNASF